eukprot:g6146.t1
MDSSEPQAAGGGAARGLAGRDGQKDILQPSADSSSPPTFQASNDDDASLGWAAKLYQNFFIPTGRTDLPGATTIPSIVAAEKPRTAAVGTAWTTARASDAPPKRRGANTRPTAALVAAACRNRASIGTAARAFPAGTKPVAQRSSSRLVSGRKRRSTIGTETTTESSKRRCVGRSSPKQDDGKAAGIGITRTASSAPATKTGRGNNKTARSAGRVGRGGTSRAKKSERGPETASNSSSTFPEYDMYGYSNKSFQAECKRRALLELARADMDLVNLERDFKTKNTCFDDAKAAHNTLHRRWVKSTQTLEAACTASNVYFEAEERARQMHVAACRDMQAAEVRVREAMTKSALAQATMRKATEASRAAKQQAAAYFNGNAAMVAVKAFGTCETARGGCHDDAGSSSPGNPGNSRKRSHSDFNGQSPNVAIAPTNPSDRDHATEAKHVDDGGILIGEGWSQDEETDRSAKTCSTTGIHALSGEHERHSHAGGLHAQHEIPAGTELQAADAVAKASLVCAPDLEVGLGAVASAFAIAGRNTKDAIESTRRTSADLDSAKAACEVSRVAALETEAALQKANMSARPYVSWVNNEVARQRDLDTWTKELMGAASRAWDAREEARKTLNKAGERVSTAKRFLKSFPRGDKVDTSRHALFQIVVEDERQRHRGIQ